MKPIKRASKDPLLSPRYHEPNPRESIIENAVFNAVSQGIIKDPFTKCKQQVNYNTNSYQNSDEISIEMHKTFYSNSRVQEIANKYIFC